jgi:hypothetical protein
MSHLKVSSRLIRVQTKRVELENVEGYTLKISCNIKAHFKHQTFTNSMIIRAKLS